MKYQPMKFDHLLGTAGFSDNLLKNHFTLYQGYLNNTNKLYDLLQESIRNEKAADPEFSETKRRFGWEFNGMRLHEYYFSSMIKGGNNGKENFFLRKINDNFGSFHYWERNFKNMGKIRGIGWVILSYDPLGDRLFNIWVNEHDGGNLAGSIPLLVMDVFEHAYMLDYGLKKEDYIAAFFNAINWKVVSGRLQKEKELVPA